MKAIFHILFVTLFASCAMNEAAPPTTTGGSDTVVQISPAQAKEIGQKIWQNECGGTVAGLTSWNTNEYFASLGIGHFIWYTKAKRGPFEESFPPLIRFMKAKNVSMPAWVAAGGPCPWNSRTEFLAAQNSSQMNELRSFLHRTIPEQTEFIFLRLQSALPKMLAIIPAGERPVVEGRFRAVAGTSRGKYALMDYVNFKGEGTNPGERYKGEGWGMLQVLQEMKGKPIGNAATTEYASAAERVLTRRVQNAPKKESQWLPGWTNRCRSYRP
jgi:hypothetical protein